MASSARAARAVVVGATLALLCACTYSPRAGSSEQGYLDLIRTYAPGARAVSDETLIRMGYQLCRAEPDPSPLEQRALVLLFDETHRFEIAEFEIITWAKAIAEPMCNNLLESPDSSAYDQADLPQLTDDIIDEARAEVIEDLRDRIAREPRVLAIEELTLDDGLVSARLTVAPPDVSEATTEPSCAAARAFAEVHAQFDEAPLIAALIFGSPEAEFEVEVASGNERLLTRSDATDLERLQTGTLDCDAWRDLTEREP